MRIFSLSLFHGIILALPFNYNQVQQTDEATALPWPRQSPPQPPQISPGQRPWGPPNPTEETQWLIRYENVAIKHKQGTKLPLDEASKRHVFLLTYSSGIHRSITHYLDNIDNNHFSEVNEHLYKYRHGREKINVQWEYELKRLWDAKAVLEEAWKPGPQNRWKIAILLNDMQDKKHASQRRQAALEFIVTWKKHRGYLLGEKIRFRKEEEKRRSERKAKHHQLREEKNLLWAGRSTVPRSS